MARVGKLIADDDVAVGPVLNEDGVASVRRFGPDALKAAVLDPVITAAPDHAVVGVVDVDVANPVVTGAGSEGDRICLVGQFQPVNHNVVAAVQPDDGAIGSSIDDGGFAGCYGVDDLVGGCSGPRWLNDLVAEGAAQQETIAGLGRAVGLVERAPGGGRGGPVRAVVPVVRIDIERAQRRRDFWRRIGVTRVVEQAT